MRIKHLLLVLFLLATVCPAQAQPTPNFQKQLAKAATDSQRLTIYRSIYDHYNSMAVDSAVRFMDEGWQRFTKSGYKRGQAGILLLQANMYNEKGMYVVSREKGAQALAIFAKLKDAQGIGKAHTNMGNAESYLGNYPEAVKHFLTALHSFEQIKDTIGLVNTYLELGAANDFNSNHEKALEYYEKALGLALQKEAVSIVYLYNNIGLYHARKGKFEEALKYFEKAELKSRNPKYVKARMPPLTNLGKVYNAMGNNKKALEYLEQAKNLAISLNAKEPLCRVLLEIGEIEGLETPPNTAALEEGLALARQIDSKRLQAAFLSALAAVADRTGDYKQEVALLKQARVLRDSIFNIDKATEIANLESAYQLNLTSTQLAALEHAEMRNAQKKDLIIIIAVVLAITLLTLLAFYTRSRRLNRELSVREQDLKKANGIKDRLFSIIGHDLKGPIGNIPNLLSIYRDESTTEKEKTYILDTMEESSQASLETLEKLLSWGQQQIKGNTYNPAQLDAVAILNYKIRLLNVAAANKNITIVNNVPPETQLYADENHFKFIMRNLISNAVKFTHPGGRVAIHATQRPGDAYLTLSVKDNGMGIDEETQQHIFEPYNTSTPGTANEAGTSIGLMLCKEFVTQNGGKIWVESSKEGGSTFYFTVKGKLGVQERVSEMA